MFGHIWRAFEIHAGGNLEPLVRVILPALWRTGLDRTIERFDVMQHLLLLLGRERAQFFHDGFGDAHNFNVKIASNAKCGKPQCSHALGSARAPRAVRRALAPDAGVVARADF
jgi:hypothetical protein